MQINTDGLVIMERTVGESDRLVTLLTREEGIIRAFSPLAKTLKSKQGSAKGFYVKTCGVLCP